MKDVQSSRGSNTNIELGTLELEVGRTMSRVHDKTRWGSHCLTSQCNDSGDITRHMQSNDEVRDSCGLH